MPSLRVNETKLTLRNAFVLDLFALGGEKESKYNERTPFLGLRAETLSLRKSSISYNDDTWQSYALPKEDPKKYMNHVTHPLTSAVISIFSQEISKFCYMKKYKYRLHSST